MADITLEAIWQAELLQVWKKLLQNDAIGLDDDFFAMGGDSLLATELITELERCTGRTVPDSLLFEASVGVFGERAFPLHLFSILAHGLVGGTLFLLVRRVTDRPLLALLAGLLFLSCEDHSMGVGWISTMTDLVCVLFVNIALIAHALWLEKRRSWLMAVSLAAVVPALLSKESV